MLPFRVRIAAGEPPFKQVVFAATKAIVAGELPPGSQFPSVRELSHELKINPNTAHKVVAELVRMGLLDVLPGVGTVVSAARRATEAERSELLSKEVEELVVEALRLGLSEPLVLDAVRQQWAKLAGSSLQAVIG